MADEEDGDVDEEEICVDFLNGACSKNLCKKLHASRRSYHWQINSGSPNGPEWLNLPLPVSDEIEVNFGYPNDPAVPLTSIEELSAHAATFPTVVGLLRLMAGLDGWEVDFADWKNLRLVAHGARNKLSFRIRRVSTPSVAMCKDKWATRLVDHVQGQVGHPVSGPCS